MIIKEATMFKRTMILTLGLLAVFSFTATCLAAGKGNKRKGKYTYRMIYESCFDRGEVENKRPPISPDEKTQAQWDRVFDKKDFEDFGCTEEWNNLSEKDLLNIQAYLHGHAADSPSPAKCE